MPDKGELNENSKQGGYLFICFPIFRRRDMECFFEPELEMALAGKAEIACDFTDVFRGICQQRFRLLQFTAIDIVA